MNDRALIALTAILVILLLTSCISIPIPPYGENIGKFGAVTINFGYKMASSHKTETEKSDEATNYAFQQFSKTLKDK